MRYGAAVTSSRPPARLPPRLPIDDVLGDITAALRGDRGAVIVAPPGAGKTTRVPAALLDAGLAGDRDIVVLEPRRLATRMAARRVAAERGEPVGRTIGYEVRFERKVGPGTRVRFVTEGVLTRQLLGDPTLARVGLVLIDEFHERHLTGDLALALLRRLQRGARPDLRIAVMSATLDPGPVAAFLGDCPVIVSEGRQFPVDIEHAPLPDDAPLEKRVAAAVRRALDGAGDVLIFLPGAAEIRRSMEACAELGARRDLLLLPLHGDLPAAEQDRAVAPAERRKVIFATNVAETSITIEGVTCVIDAGLARVARHSPWSGIPTLRVEPISRASAAQRAGRAGRTAPGRCMRLYTRHDHDTRRDFDAPEVARMDLAEAALQLHALGVRRLDDFGWFEPPPEAATRAAGDLLQRLGAIDAAGALTEVGRRMLRFPVHPRQGRMLVEAERRGVAREGCVLAALVGERALRQRTSMRGGPAAAAVSGPSDLIDDLDSFAAAARDKLVPHRLRGAGLDASAVMAVDRARQRLERLVENAVAEPDTEEAADQALQVATLAGYPDRVARRRRPGSAEVVFAGGGSARLSPASVVIDAAFVVAVEAQERGRDGAVVHRASAVDPAWLLDLFIERVTERDEMIWNAERARVERVSSMAYDGLVIDEQRDPAGARHDPARAGAVLAEAALAAGIERFVDGEALAAWRRRVAFAARAASRTGNEGRIAAPTDEVLAAALRDACVGIASFDELRRMGLLEALQAQMSGEARQLMERLAPAFVQLPGRRRVPVQYEEEQAPWIASRLQDFFGLERGPAVAEVPLVLHLLAPNQRAVQVTSDLAGFWQRHYPALRKQLMRRYPRHGWPEDPLSAEARASAGRPRRQ